MRWNGRQNGWPEPLDELTMLREQKERIEAEERRLNNDQWRKAEAEKLRKQIRNLGHKPCA